MPTDPPPSYRRYGGTPTGRWRRRKVWGLFPVVEVEVGRDVWRPRFTGHTPGNWERVTFWVKGDGADTYTEQVT